MYLGKVWVGVRHLLKSIVYIRYDKDDRLQSRPSLRMHRTACRTKFLFKFDLILNDISPSAPHSMLFFFAFPLPVTGFYSRCYINKIEVTATLNGWRREVQSHAEKTTHRSTVFGQDCKLDGIYPRFSI